MKFAHLSDCHIGSWRDIRLNEASTKAFIKVMDICKKENVDFILIAGDLFDTSLPSVDRLKDVTLKLKEIKDYGINIYVIPGSHDFSPTGKTMLDVLENAGLFVNVAKGEINDEVIKLKFTADEKTGAKITGIPGLKGTLERKYYEKLYLKNLEDDNGFKIFMLHSLITELKPEKDELGESTPSSFLPKGFNYYAGGHPHRVMQQHLKGYGLIAYPGPLFPNNMAELEKLHNGGFYIVEASEFHHSVNGGQGGILSVIKNHRDRRGDDKIMPPVYSPVVFDMSDFAHISSECFSSSTKASSGDDKPKSPLFTALLTKESSLKYENRIFVSTTKSNQISPFDFSSLRLPFLPFFTILDAHSENSFSSSDSACLSSSKVLSFFSSISCANLDQFTQSNFSISDLISSGIANVTLGISAPPAYLDCFSNSLSNESFIISPCRTTSVQFISGKLSSFPFNSCGIDTVIVAIFHHHLNLNYFMLTNIKLFKYLKLSIKDEVL